MHSPATNAPKMWCTPSICTWVEMCGPLSQFCAVAVAHQASNAHLSDECADHADDAREDHGGHGEVLVAVAVPAGGGGEGRRGGRFNSKTWRVSVSVDWLKTKGWAAWHGMPYLRV
jgi:hypothetical protein